ASPEHAQGKRVDGRSDLYSLGIILFEGLAGRPPFQAPSTAALLLKQVQEPAPPLWKAAPHAPKRVNEIVRRLLAKNPASRYDTALALRRDLEQVLDELGSGAAAPAVTPTARRTAKSIAPPKTSRRWPVVLAAAAVLAVLGGWFLAGRDSAPRAEVG